MKQITTLKQAAEAILADKHIVHVDHDGISLSLYDFQESINAGCIYIKPEEITLVEWVHVDGTVQWRPKDNVRLDPVFWTKAAEVTGTVEDINHE